MAGKTVLIIDAGGRGAALVHKYSQSPKVRRLIVIPGNQLMQINSKKPVKIFPQLKTTSVIEILKICQKEKVDLVDVAQDNAVEVGLVDELKKIGIAAIGPTRLAGQIEWDKGWARDFMKKYKIPQPSYKVFNSQKLAKDFIKKNPNKKYFVKAAGLVEGKGALPAGNIEEANSAIDQMSKFGKEGERFVIEDWLEGEEFSAFAIADGRSYKIIGFAQDHKRLYDGDLGPNTGGIGSNSAPMIVNKKNYQQADQILRKTIEGLAKEKRDYVGILYLGAIVVKGKVYVVEFNSRWGDPEVEVLVPGVKNDLYDLSMAAINGSLSRINLKLDGKTRIAVTASLRAGVEAKKRRLFGLESILKIPGITVYSSRVTKSGNKFFVAAGRLFHVVAEGKDINDARRKAYSAMSQVFVEGNNLHYRTDIGWRDLEREYDSSN